MSGERETLRILIDGMHCGNCAMNVEKHIKEVKGVDEVNVSLASNSGKIKFDPKVTSEEEILAVFDNLSFTATKVESTSKLKVLNERKEKAQKQAKKDIIDLAICAAITIVVVCICMVPGWHMAAGDFLANLFGIEIDGDDAGIMVSHMQAANVLLMILTIPVQFYFGWRFYKGAYESMRSGMPNMDVLVALSTSIAFLYSVYMTFEDVLVNDGMPYFETCCMLITFVMLGKILESRAKMHAGDAVEKLIKLTPEKVTVVKKDGTKKKVDIDDVFPGEVLVVKKGDNFPVDGDVTEGDTKVDESMLTGEAELVEKTFGNAVSAGTVNMGQEVLITATSVGADTQLAHIISAVEDAEATKPTIQRTADKIAAVFVPAILLIALITFWGWILYGNSYGWLMSETIQKAMIASIATICVACPCALGLATPTALMVGMGKGAEAGILIKDGEMLERACKISACIFDKTGTLTTGVVTEGKHSTVIVKKDSIKPEAAEAISQLKERGVASWMVSGDKEVRANIIAKEVGIEKKHVISQVLPTEKGDCVDRIRRKVRLSGNGEDAIVAFVGDGINDAPALAKADVSIAMSSGTDVAIGAGSIVLTHNKVTDVVSAIDLSRATLRKIKQNLFWALIYNCIMVPLAAFGILAPALAGAAMAASSVCVVTNSLMLKKQKI